MDDAAMEGNPGARYGAELSQLGELAEFRFQLRSFLSFSEIATEQVGITVQQYQMLQVVAHAGADGCSISALARRLLLRHNSAVELVDRGERSGLLVRRPDERDQRRSMLEMTAHGRALLSGLVSTHLQYLRENGQLLAESLRTIMAGTPSAAAPASSEAGPELPA